MRPVIVNMFPIPAVMVRGTDGSAGSAFEYLKEIELTVVLTSLTGIG